MSRPSLLAIYLLLEAEMLELDEVDHPKADVVCDIVRDAMDIIYRELTDEERQTLALHSFDSHRAGCTTIPIGCTKLVVLARQRG